MGGMKITIRVFATLRDELGWREKTLELSHARLIDVINMFPELKERVITSEGKVHEHYRIFVNGVYIDFAGGLERRLEDGDVIAVFPALAGGDS